MRARNRTLFGITLALALALAPSARALDISDVYLVNFPLGGANTGLVNAGPDFDFAIDETTTLICAGAGVFQAVNACAGKSGYDITITQDLQTVHQNPQARGSVPSPSDPFIADSEWTATNTSGQAYDEPVLLLFTNVGLGPNPGAPLPNGYPDLQVGLDANLLDIVLFSVGGAGYFFGAVNLGLLQPDESVTFTVRYIVSSGPMPIVDNDIVMPPLKVVGASVPEPGTFVLLLAGLAGTALVGRKR
jgi:hypothetical protein